MNYLINIKILFYLLEYVNKDNTDIYHQLIKIIKNNFILITNKVFRLYRIVHTKSTKIIPLLFLIPKLNLSTLSTLNREKVVIYYSVFKNMLIIASKNISHENYFGDMKIFYNLRVIEFTESALDRPDATFRVFHDKLITLSKILLNGHSN